MVGLSIALYLRELMMAPVAGPAVAELIADGECTTFDINGLAVDRFERGRPLLGGSLV